MKERKNWGKIAGLVLHILIGALLIFTGSQKVLGLVPPEALVKYGLGEQMRLIGVGALLRRGKPRPSKVCTSAFAPVYWPSQSATCGATFWWPPC